MLESEEMPYGYGLTSLKERDGSSSHCMQFQFGSREYLECKGYPEEAQPLYRSEPMPTLRPIQPEPILVPVQ